MNDHNHVSIAGRLTRDPEMRHLQSGTSLCNFSIAVNKSYTSNGEKKEEVSFFNCVAWGRLAEIINQYCRKGKQVLIGGSLKQESWQDSEGKRRDAVKIVADTLQMLGSRGDDQGQGGDYDPAPSLGTPARNVPPLPGGHAQAHSQSADEDDIPF